MCAHETPTTNVEVLDQCFHVLLFNLIASLLTLCGPNKGLCFLHQLGDWCHEKGKVLDETFIKLSHTIKDLNILWIGKYWHVHYFFRVPSLEIMNHESILKIP
jgi:hypothetical protein